MKRIIVVHGWGGSPHNDWLPWVAVELKKLGYEVDCRDFPETENPTIEKWVPFLSQVVGTPDENTYFIGHSIGCQTIMRYLEAKGVRVGGAIFVAGWFDLLNLGDDEKGIGAPWLERPIDTEKAKSLLGFSVSILSEDDPDVPYEGTKERFERLLHSEIVTVQDAGHFTESDGYGPFPQLIEIIKQKIPQS